MHRLPRLLAVIAVLGATLVLPAATASATPVCTDGYKGGPPLAACGGRIFPEAALSRAYVQYTPNAQGFAEYRHGLEYLAQKYPRWVEVFTLTQRFDDPRAVTAGADKIRPNEPGDTKDGREILVVKITDENVPDEGKETLLFSLSVHGVERGGLEGGLRTAEDLAVAAQNGGTIVDGYDNYTSATGRKPKFNTYQVKDVLAKEAVYLVDFNIDGWVAGELPPGNMSPSTYGRGNSIGTDLNRQMPTIGRINTSRNPLTESEMVYGERLMREVADDGVEGEMAHAADIHGELNSRAYVDIMYPAGQFSPVDHRRLMAIAERTKSVIDETLYLGIQNEIEEATGGNDKEGVEEMLPAPVGPATANVVPTMPAHWATVWDTLGYTDTGFIGDYMATDLGVTGMDYEFQLNHQVPERVWNVYTQENYINGTRAIIKTAMAYALTQRTEFTEDNVVIDPKGRAGYVFNPDLVTDADANGPGRLPGPLRNGVATGVGQNGKPVEQRPYSATSMRWFTDTSRLMGDKPFVPLTSFDIARDSRTLDAVDTLVLADVTVPADPFGRAVDQDAYFANLKAWVQRGGNLVLTDRAVHSLSRLGLVGADKVTDIKVYMPYTDITDFSHPLVARLRSNARQLVEAAVLGYEIGNTASPMTSVDQTAFTAAGGKVVGTTGTNRVTLGEVKVGDGVVRVIGGALPAPTEINDHRYGLRDYALTYSGTFLMENAIAYDAPGLGTAPAGPVATPPFSPDPPVPPSAAGSEMLMTGSFLLVWAGVARRRQRQRLA